MRRRKEEGRVESALNVLEVWGELACFSRPEMKVERFSYPCITPSAARGVFDAVYARPREFRWEIRKIEILNPISYIALRRNEVKEKVNVNAVYDWMSGKKASEPLWADGDRDLLGTDEKGRTQRQTMALRNVRYRLHASIRAWTGFDGQIRAIREQFRRRSATGKCFYQPYLGCREFPAYFQPAEIQESVAPVSLDMEVGLMLYDVFDLSRPGSAEDENAISLFNARIRAGVLDVPEYASPDVLKPGRGTH
jgi:CRISPR-associated protein Cas5d